MFQSFAKVAVRSLNPQKLLLGLVSVSVGAVEADVITVVQQLPTTGPLPALYQTNRAPLQPVPLMKLPPGSIVPQGWLQGQLLLDVGGLPGRMEQISDYLTPQNGWVNTNYANGWEEVPYWLRGYQELGYVMNNQTIINDAVTNWLEKMIATQITSGTNAGVFGPSSIYIGANDIWAQMPACEALRHYYDHSHNPAVISFMTNYFNWLNANQSFIGPGWANPRWGDHLETMYWLYNITGQPFLLSLATTIQSTVGGQWLDGGYPWHNVNFAQGFREPAEYWMQSGNASHLAAAEGDYDQVMNRWGAYPGGGFSGDEVCRPGYGDPRQGFETCGHVEFMKSFEILTRITGNPVWADRCEEIAFNRLPTVTPPDHSGVCYLSEANSVEKVNEPQLHNQFEDSPQSLLAYMPGTHQYRCCPHNYAMGWPYFAEELWLATMDNGLCASLYAPSQVTANVTNGGSVTISEVTDYPFSNTINLTISMAGSQPLVFPLYLRVPRWCASNTASLQINGSQVPIVATPLSYIKIQRAWTNGDMVSYTMPMQLGVTTWATNNNAVSINYGPLEFALGIQEHWSTLPVANPNSTDWNFSWPGYQVLPGSAWNYGLALNAANPTNGIQVVQTSGPLPANPFIYTNSTVSLIVPAQIIPGWTMDVDYLGGMLQPSPVLSTQTVQNITLIPMGSAPLRISTFPTIGSGTNARVWSPKPTPSASYCNGSDTVMALCDGIAPKSSSDTSKQRFTWYDHLGTTEWVEYDFPQPFTITSTSVYWYDDRGGVQLPVSWQLLYENSQSNWVPVSNPSGYGLNLNAYNTTTFSAVTTSAVRLQAVLSTNYAAGILQWQLPLSSQLPSVPTGLMAVAGNAQVALNWGAANGATSYNVKRSTTSGAETIIANVTTTGYADTGLANGTTYYYAVSAMNTSGQSANSSEVSGTAGLLALPSGTVGFWPFNQSSNLGADYSGQGNNLQVKTGAPAWNISGQFAGGSLSLNGSSTMTTASGGFPAGVPTGNNAYTIAVWEKAASGCPNNGGFVGWGDNSTGEANNLRLNGANSVDDYWWANDFVVSRLAANPMDGNWHAIAVTWNGTTETLYVDGGNAGTRTPTAPTVQGANFIVGATTGDVDFQGNLQNLLIANVALTPAQIANFQSGFLPTVPTGLTATAGINQVALQWNAVTGAGSYNVQRATTNGGPYTIIASPATTNYTDTRVTEGTSYYYVVAAVNSLGSSADSSQVSATPHAPPTLSITMSSGVLNFSWPGWAAGSVYAATNLTPPVVWSPLTNAPVNSNGMFYVSLPLGSGEQFFQLSGP